MPGSEDVSPAGQLERESFGLSRAELRSGVVVLVLMGLTAVGLMAQGELRVAESADIAMELPRLVGDYTGQEVLFCQNEACLRVYETDELPPGSRHCPECKTALDPISLGEKQMLPADTRIVRRQYRDGLGNEVLASIVLNGREQRSIHRPQQCLPAQGHTIEGSRIVPVSIPGRPPLRIMLLDTRRVVGFATGGRLASYAYWFVGGGHETPDHFERLFHMSADMLLRGQAARWAYVGIQTSRDGNSDRHVRRISDFVARLYPLISTNAEIGGAGAGPKSALKPDSGPDEDSDLEKAGSAHER